MSLTTVRDDLREEEDQVQQVIFDAIDNSENFVFNAGAGAGKTHSLIESLKHILKNYGAQLARHNQSVVCITYTNVAADEIKARLKYTDVVEVSTIHEKLWGLIKLHQTELLLEHKAKLESELEQLNYELNTNNDPKIEGNYRSYRSLNEDKKALFKEYIQSNKERFYQNRERSAATIKSVFETELSNYEGIIKNVEKFKKIVSTIYKIDNFKTCLQRIIQGLDGYQVVKYDSKYNTDVLYRMIISHDTLLVYALEMVKKYDMLKRIIIDSHPYILIDEYQDTHSNVIEIISLLSHYAEQIKHPLLIGYFGDKAQNIYDEGIGSELSNNHAGLKTIEKRFNRRSNSEIINVINLIRNDEIKQSSIYSDSEGGAVEFYYSDCAEGSKRGFIDSFIARNYKDWSISNKNKLHCLVLKNKLLAQLAGFPKIYDAFAKSSYYRKGKNFERIKNELLGPSREKLGRVQTILFSLLRLRYLLANQQTPITELLSESITSSISFADLKQLLQDLNLISGTTFNEYLTSIFKAYDEKNGYFKQVFDDELSGLDFEPSHRSYSVVYDYLLKALNPDLSYKTEEEIGQARGSLDALLNIRIEEYELWFNFVSDKQKGEIVYHTYHGTKGIEFNNVVIFMENDFGRLNKKKFSSFFENVPSSTLTAENELAKFENTKNLLYVSCSRSIHNLRILYLDDITPFQSGVEHIFGNVRKYRCD